MVSSKDDGFEVLVGEHSLSGGVVEGEGQGVQVVVVEVVGQDFIHEVNKLLKLDEPGFSEVGFGLCVGFFDDVLEEAVC